MRVRVFEATAPFQAGGRSAASALEDKINEFLDDEAAGRSASEPLKILDVKFQRYTREDTGQASYSALVIYE